MAKKMILGDGVKIRTTERLKEYWELPKVLAYYKDGTLVDWLMKDSGAEKEIKDKVNAIETEKITDAKEIAKRLCEAFGVPFDEASFVDLEELDKIKAREEKLRKITADEEIIKNIDKVAFDQKEMNELLDKGVKTIYLVNNKFYIDLDEENITYKGVGEAIAVIDSKKVVPFKALGIEFKDIAFDEKYAAILKSAFNEKYAAIEKTDKQVGSQNEINSDVSLSDSDLVERMIRAAEKCKDEANGNLGGNLYVNRAGCMPTNKLANAIEQFEQNVGEKIDKRDIIALFIAEETGDGVGFLGLVKCLSFALFIKTGIYFAIANVTPNPIKFVKWKELIKAKSEVGLDDSSEKSIVDTLPGMQMLNKSYAIIIKMNDSVVSIGTRNQKTPMFLARLINTLNEIYLPLGNVSFNPLAKIMMKAVEDLQKETPKNLAQGKLNINLYIGDKLPSSKLDAIIQLISVKLPEVHINPNELVALYQDDAFYSSSVYKSGFLGNLLITSKGFYFCRLTNTKSWHKFMEWNKLPYVKFNINNTNKRVEIEGNLGLWLSKQDYEVVAPNFIVPLLNKLRDVDILE